MIQHEKFCLRAAQICDFSVNRALNTGLSDQILEIFKKLAYLRALYNNEFLLGK
jgi:hypothetical protein